MKRNKRAVYFWVNIVVVLLAVAFASLKTETFTDVQLNMGTQLFYLVPLFLVGFFFVHLAKMMRFYLILMEQKINFFRFIKVYMKITLVNLALPFKMGEIFRIYCYSKETKDGKIGILSVVIDRLFDTTALLVILIPYDFLVDKQISPVTLILSLFAAVIVFLYRIFLPTYYYLNRYFIMNTNSKQAVRCLYILESGKTWYDYIRRLLKGRSSLIFIFSCVGWIAEFGVLMCMQTIFQKVFGISGFVEYINSIFGLGDTWLLNSYTTVSCIILAVITVSVYGISYLNRRETVKC
ncbi:lysylphosphatidylglycerol synthase domain-containing protein [Konateibacter massiliensis]|uniref:lysylphosphatidylglycerol synthase domain-containing protein n=1 Tax=Konateibacter massiliensis TaxID=2002841 RepID=UPI000C14A80B|nr:lysylphosphatidylglycerol synthase domain-containing protein [Konateibacter massiliensis]